MELKYYFDTCIWIDYFENRSDKFRPLGDWALTLINKIIKNNKIILYSNLVEEELNLIYSKDKVQKIFGIIPKQILIKINSTEEQLKEAIYLSKKLKIPVKDCLHAILARDNNSILVTRDKHFLELLDIVKIKKPEDLI